MKYLSEIDKIDMFTDYVEFEGVRFSVNGFNQQKSINNVMPLFLEEQPATFYIVEDVLKRKLKDLHSKVLDVGCGSGFWALLLKKKYPNADVFGLDKNIKAIQYCERNASLNQLKINFKNDIYTEECYSSNSFDIIVLTPPYHLYPHEIESKIPFFARGGSSGQEEFKAQLKKAKYHLKKDGVIVFNMMCIGTTHGPNYINYIRSLFGDKVFLEITNIFPPIETSYFLNKVYPLKDFETETFISSISNDNPLLYYTSGWLSPSKNFDIQIKESSLILNRGWDDRIKLHQQINEFTA